MSGFQKLLGPSQLTKLKEHKYSCVNYSLLDPYMNPFWIWLVDRCPQFIHPNSLTVSGLAVNAVTTLLLVWYSPDALTPAPVWTYLVCALGIFIYQTLDAMDGKHARKTGTSSQLGELFDHGCDSISTLLVTVGVCIAIQMGAVPFWLCYYVFAALGIFYLAHWQTFVTGSLQFGRFEVTEIQFLCIGLHLISTIFGSDVWNIGIPLAGITLRGVTVWIMVLGTIINMLTKLAVILGGGPGRNGSAVGNMSILSPAWPLAFWLYSAYYVHQNSQTVADHPLLFLFAWGIIMAKLTNRLVIAHVTQSEMTFLDTAFIIPLIMMGRIYWNTLGWISDHFLLWACVIHATFDLGLYLTRMCVEIRDFLGIRVFSMVPVPTGSRPNAPPSGQHPPLRRSIPSRINVKDGSGRVPLSPQSSRNTGGSSTLSR
ncbi:hypothetical protein RvY_00996 [Ramazzottius varieornatus]|uniref:diacylglycerol cholinephosphotransferase n=1 Tax=Ramazzottius varieornatus TaxID=947166 RepID=A0A1D1UQ31_RAMVA|nr:hypothetical protein RvY_00996 [Ramazzottius varieornatus]